MHDKDSPKVILNRSRAFFWNWNGWHVLFLIAPCLCLLLFVPKGRPSYLCGRLNLRLFDACLFYLVVAGVLLFCFMVSLLRFLLGRKQNTHRIRLLIATEIIIPVVVAALIIANMAHTVVSDRPPPGTVFLHGYADRVRCQVDISSIREWLKTLDKADYIPRRDFYSSEKLPKPLQGLGLGMVYLSADKSGNPTVNFSAGGGFHHWGATIGMEDLVIPESDLKFSHDAWLIVEPGVYIYAW